MALRDQIGMGCGVTGVGLLLLSGGLLFGGSVVCGGAFSDLWQRMPEVVEVAPPVIVPGTPPAPIEPAHVPEPFVFDLPAPSPEPVPAPSPRVAAPVVELEAPVAPEDAPAPEPMASILVEGDAVGVVAVASDGSRTTLPASLPRGVYNVLVTFESQPPFRTGSFAVHDSSTRTVQCRAHLALCRVR